MRKERIFPHHYYHIYNRGVNSGKIFFTEDNWNFFLRRLRHYCLPEKGLIIAYCLMPTHYHLLAYVLCDDFGRQVMHPFSISYTKAVNKQQERSGHLFQGPFQFKRIDEDTYLTHLTRYIHKNPVAAGYVDQPADWVYSSYLDYIDQRQGTLPVKDRILNSFSSPQAYQRFVEETQETKTISHLMLD